MTGNQAIARGAFEAGVRVATSHPGHPCSEVLETIAKFPKIYSEWSINEKVALEIAIGASIAGSRAISIFKNVGLNVAADPLVLFSLAGVGAGLVIVVGDDVGMAASPSDQDDRHYGRLAHIPVLEPSSGQEAKDFTKKAFELSEEFDTPVLLRLMTPIALGKFQVSELPPRRAGNRGLTKGLHRVHLSVRLGNESKFSQFNEMERGRPRKVSERIEKLRSFAESFPENSVEINKTDCGIITSGSCYNYAKEAFPEYSFLKLGMVYPLPAGKIKDFSSKMGKVYVIEELGPFMEEQIKAAGVSVKGKDIFPDHGRFTPGMIARNIKENRKYESDYEYPEYRRVCAGCPYRALFHSVKKVVADRGVRFFITGDTGCMAELRDWRLLDASMDMGGSISMAAGLSRAAGINKSVTLIGDGAFFHSGLNGLMNAVWNKSAGTVIICNNHVFSCTGGQVRPGSGLNIRGELTEKIEFETLCRAIGIKHITKINPYEIEEVRKVLKTEIDRPELSVVISDAPCVMYAKNTALEWKFKVDAHKCKGCRKCFKYGCPAIERVGRKSVINADACAGCGVCSRICGWGAISAKN